MNDEALTLAEQFKHRADDAGMLARAILSTPPPVAASKPDAVREAKDIITGIIGMFGDGEGSARTSLPPEWMLRVERLLNAALSSPQPAHGKTGENVCCEAARRGNGHVFGCVNYRWPSPSAKPAGSREELERELQLCIDALNADEGRLWEDQIDRLRQVKESVGWLQRSMTSQMAHRGVSDEAFQKIAKAVGYTGSHITDLPAAVLAALPPSPAAAEAKPEEPKP